MLENFTIHNIDRDNLLTRINLTIDNIEELFENGYVNPSDWIYDYKSYHTYSNHLSGLTKLVEQFNNIHPKDMSCSAEWIYYFEDFSNKVLTKLEKETYG